MNPMSARRDARITIVVPAKNAAETIVETLASVRAQTVERWRVIVVDDGSTDGTATAVRGMAAGDARIALIRGPERDVGAARNAGLRAVETPFVSFLDADDLLSPTFVEQTMAAFARRPDAAAAYTGWLRLALDGRTEEGPCPDVEGDLFEHFAAACVFPPHACVVRRSVIEEAVGFDEAPTTTEDWDLWQRIARTGACFVRVPGNLVTYRMRLGSRSRDSRRVLDDGLAVIARGHAADERVRRPHPSHQHGADASLLARRSYNHLSWAVGMAIASEEDPAPLIETVRPLRAADLNPWEIAGTVLEAMRVTLGMAPEAAASVAATAADGLRRWLSEIESASGTPDLTLRIVRAIDYIAMHQSALDRPRTLLGAHELSVELAHEVEDITRVPARADRLHAHLAYDGAVFGRIELPISGGHVAAPFIADAAADALGWQMLQQFLFATTFSSLELEEGGDRVRVRRYGVAIGEVNGGQRPSRSALFAAVGWTIFVQELFGITDRDLHDIYEAAPGGGMSGVTIDGPELVADAGHPIHDVTSAAAALTVRCMIGGAWLGDLTLAVVDGCLSAGAIRRALVETWPDELIRTVAREAIVGRPLHDGTSLHARIAGADRNSTRRARRALPGGGLAVTRDANSPVSSPALRLVALPAAGRASIERLARATGQAMLSVPRSAADPIQSAAAYLPDVPLAPGTAAARNLTPQMGAAIEQPEPADRASDSVLVLAYQRVAEHGPGLSDPRLTAPRDFDDQLSWLRSAGYRGFSPDEWRAAIRPGTPIRGRRVVLTFEGGYHDFEQHAWPALVRHGFDAVVFLVTEAIGRTTVWDARTGERVRRLDWSAIRRLHADGVTFGSGTVSHPWLTGRPLESLVAELFDSRSELEEGLRSAVECLCYPYGAEDEAVRRLAGAAGYRVGVSGGTTPWTRYSDRLSVAKTVVSGSISIADFAARVSSAADGTR